MKKALLIAFLFVFGALGLQAQCPYISGAMINAADVGTPAGEGKSEFMAFTTGTSPLSVNGFSVGFGTTTAASTFTIDGATVTWQTLAVSPAITNSAGSITNISSGSIPANTAVVILNAANTISYDLATFGPSVYVLVYAAPSSGVSGYNASGNFANKSSPSALRYFRISAGACNNVVSYDRNDAAFSNADGAGAKWDAAGTITFANTGSSGAVLPINLLHFDVQKYLEKAQINWVTSGNSTEAYFEIERSNNGILFSKIAAIPFKKDNINALKEYSYVDNQATNGQYFYRIRMIDIDGSASFTPTQKISFEQGQTITTNLYPNPVQNQLYLNNLGGFTAAIISDFMGKKIGEQKLLIGNNKIELGHLAKGFYVVQIISATGIENHKIIKE